MYGTKWRSEGGVTQTVCVGVCVTAHCSQQTFSSSKRRVKWRISANCLASACSLSRCWVGVKGGHVRHSNKLCRASSADPHTHIQTRFRCQVSSCYMWKQLLIPGFMIHLGMKRPEAFLKYLISHLNLNGWSEGMNYCCHWKYKEETFCLALWSYLVWGRSCRTSWVWWPAGRQSSTLAPAAWSHWGFELPVEGARDNIRDWSHNGHQLRAAVCVCVFLTSLISWPAPLYACRPDRMLSESWRTEFTWFHTSRSPSVGCASDTQTTERLRYCSSHCQHKHFRADESHLFTSRIILQVFVIWADLTLNLTSCFLSKLYTVTWCERDLIR